MKSMRSSLSVSGTSVLDGYVGQVREALGIESHLSSSRWGGVIFSTIIMGRGHFQLSDLAGLGYELGSGFWVVSTIIVSLT